jgi:hypothetical protein
LLDTPDRYGDPFTWPTFLGRVIVTGDPMGIREILTADPAVYSALGAELLGPVLGANNLILLSGEPHRAMRRFYGPQFHGERPHDYGAVIARIASEHSARWPHDGPFVVEDTMRAISLDVILEVVLGLGEPGTRDVFKGAILQLVRALKPSFMFIPGLRRSMLGLSAWARFRRAAALFEQEVSARRAGDRCGLHQLAIFSALFRAQLLTGNRQSTTLIGREGKSNGAGRHKDDPLQNPNLFPRIVELPLHPLVDRTRDHRDDELERRRKHRSPACTFIPAVSTCSSSRFPATISPMPFRTLRVGIAVRYVSRVLSFVLTVGLILLRARNATADFPLNFTAGPQVAWSWGKVRGFSWGWEAGAGLGVERLNVGQMSWKGERLSYAVFEPLFLDLVGATVGLGYENNTGLSPVLGLWEGIPIVYPQNCEPENRAKFGFLLTVAVGYRYFGGHHQVYLTPKAGISQSVTACSTSAGVSGGGA